MQQRGATTKRCEGPERYNRQKGTRESPREVSEIRQSGEGTTAGIMIYLEAELMRSAKKERRGGGGDLECPQSREAKILVDGGNRGPGRRHSGLSFLSLVLLSLLLSGREDVKEAESIIVREKGAVWEETRAHAFTQ